MLVVPFDAVEHAEYAKQILALRDMDLDTELPIYGLIAIKHDVPVAMGFLRCIEGNYAMLDSYITNPDSPSEIRDHALDAITRKLIDIARYEQVSKLFAFSIEPHIILRAVKHGFKQTPYIFTVLDLINN